MNMNKIAAAAALCAAVLFESAPPTVHAAIVTKWSDGTELTNAASWMTNASPAAPGSADTAMWTNSSLGAGLILSTNVAWGGISVSNAASDISISGIGILTNGGSGIDLSGSPVNLSIATPVVLSAGQTWNVNAGKTLTVSGRISGGQTLNMNNSATCLGAVTLLGGDIGNATLNVYNGTLSLSGVTNAFGQVNLGVNNSAAQTGVVSYSAGTNPISGRLNFGNTGARGIMQISGANTVVNHTSTDFIMFGGNGTGNKTGSGAIYQSGGTFNINNTSGVLMPWSANAYGAYILSGGTLNGPAAGWNVDNQNQTYGVFVQSGGAANFKNAFNICNNSTGGAHVDVSGGTMTHTNTGNFMATAANTAGNSVGVLTVRGSGVVSEQTGNFLVTATAATSGANALGIVNLLTGGTIQANKITKTTSVNSKATINCDGGKLQVNSVNAGVSFLSGLDNVLIYLGGLTVDTAGQNVTVSNALIAPAGYGVGASLSSIPVTSGGGAGYIAPPVIGFAVPSGGVPATGVAQLDGNGTVTNILVTSPGSGYTSSQSVAITFNAGNNSANEATTAATSFNATAGTLNTSGGFTKIGAGILTLAGTNTYTGGTTVSNGTLLINGALTASSITVSNGAMFGGAGLAGTATVAPNAGVQGGLVGGNGLTLSNLTFLGAGTFNAVALAQPAVSLYVPTSLALNGTITVTLANAPAPGTYHLLNLDTVSGTGSFTILPTRTASLTTNSVGGTNYLDLVVIPSPGYDVWTGTQTSDWSLSSYTPGYNWQLYSNGVALFNTDFLTADTVVFDDSANNNLVKVSVANVNPASTTFNNTNKNYVLAGSFGISAGSLAKTGNGMLTVSNVNTYPGGTTIGGGTVEFVNGGLGSGSVTMTTNSTLRWLGVNPNTLPLTVANGITATLDTTANSINYNTALGGNGTKLIKRGSGQLTLSGSNTYTNAVTVSQGTLSANIAAALGSTNNTLTLGDAGTGANSVALKVDSSVAGTVLLQAVNTTSYGTNQTILLGAGSALAANASELTISNLNLNGNIPLTIQALSAGHSTAQDINYVITGNGIAPGNTALILDGTATTLRVSFYTNLWANNFTGDVVINGAVNTQNTTYYANTANNQNNGFTNNNITVSSNANWSVVWGGETIGGLNGVGAVTLNCQQALNNLGLTVGNNNANGFFSGTFGGATWQVAKVGAGTQVLAGSNITYRAATTVNSGVLRFLDATNVHTDVTINNPGVLEVSNTVAQTWTNVFSASGNLLKSGQGVLTITSTNTGFYGSNIIAGGVESVAGDLGGASVVVSGGATLNSLGGSISSGSVMVNNGGTVSALNNQSFPMGTALTLGNTGADTANLNLSADGTTVPGFLAVSGPLNLNGTAHITISGVVPQATGTYPLITYTSFSGTGNLTLSPLPPGYTGHLTNDTTLNQVALVLTAVDSVVWFGSPNNKWDLASTNLAWKLASSGTPTYFVNQSVARFDDSAANFTANITASVVPSSISMSNAVNNYTFQGQSLSMGGTLLKDGAAGLTLVASNNLGAVDLRNGTLVAGDNEIFTNFIFENGTLQLGNGGSAGMVNLPGTFNLPTNTATLAFNRADDLTVGNTFTGNGALLKLGSDTVSLTAKSSYGGGTTVNQGTLALEQGGILGTIGGTVTINANAALRTDVADALGYGASRTTNLVVNGGALNHTPASNLSLWGMTINLTGGTLTASGGGTLDLGTDANASSTPTVVNTFASGNSSVISGNQVRLRQTPTIFTVDDGAAADDLLITAPMVSTLANSGIDKEGAGTMTINSASSFNGGAIVNGGLLKLVNDTVWASDVNLTAPGSLELSNTVAWTFPNAINGSGNLTKSGSGTVTLTQAPSHSGTTVVNGGALLVPGLNSSTSVTVNTNSTFGGQGFVSGPVTVNNGGKLSAPYNAALQMQALTLGASATDVQTLNFSANATSIAGNYSVSTFDGFTVNGTNVINVTGVLPFLASLPSTNTLITYSATTPVGASHFVVGSLPMRAAGYVIDTGTEIDLVLTSINPIYWVGSPTNSWDNSGTLDWKLANNSGTSFTNNTDAVLFDSTAANFTVNVAASVNPDGTVITNTGSYVFQGSAIQSSAPLLMEGPGSATFTANGNTFSDVVLTGGTLQIGTNGTTGSINLPATTSLGAGTTLAYDRSDAVTAGVTFTGNGTLKQMGTGTLNLTNVNNSYAGGTVISRGVVAVGLAGSAGTGTVALGDAGTGTNNVELSFANVTANGTFPDVTVNNNGTGTATISGTANAANNNPTPTTFITMNRATIFRANSLGASDIEGQLSGPGAGPGNTTLIIDGNGGTLRYSLPTGGTNNSFVGNVLITNGIFQPQNLGYIAYDDPDNNLCIPDTASVTVAANGRLHFAHTLYEVIDGLNGSGIVDNGFTAAGYSTTLIVGGNNGSGNFSGVLQDGGQSGGRGLAFTKVGTGTQILGGANTFTHPTTVSNGTLVVNGSLAAGSMVYVAPAGTLAGTGAIGGSVTNDGTISPGVGSIGTLSMNNNLTLNLGSVSYLEIARPAHDQVNASSITYGGTLTVANTGGAFVLGDSFQLFNVFSQSGSFAATNLPALASGLKWNWNPASGTLSVVNSVNTNPTNITFTVSGSTLHLSWPADHLGWHLQQQTNSLTKGLGTNWVTIPGSDTMTSTNITVDPAKPTVFYRMVYP